MWGAWAAAALLALPVPPGRCPDEQSAGRDEWDRDKSAGRNPKVAAMAGLDAPQAPAGPG